MNEDIRTLSKWLNEESTAPIDRQALARVLAFSQQAQGVGAAQAWADGYRAGINDERTSEANIGVAGFGMKVEPARENPYSTQQPQPAPLAGEREKAEADAALYGTGFIVDGWRVAPHRVHILALRPQAVPMTPEQMRAILTEAGYDDANVQARADFINGARYAERHHGITAKAQGGA